MKKMTYQNVKGTQDFLPKEESLRRQIKQTLENIFIRYGCQPLETPILNYTELMASKYAGGAEILEEMYTLTDRGERALALRYDLTIPFAKVVAMNPHLRMPFKRYEIGKVFRDGPIKTGRLREFTQCDVDIVGVNSQLAEAELMAMAIDAFQELELNVVIQYNNRKLLTGSLESLNTPKELLSSVVLTLDKFEKVGIEGVVQELTTKGLPTDAIISIQKLLSKGVNDITYFEENYANENSLVDEGIREINELADFLCALGINRYTTFNPFLARGLEIYTGTIYEIFLEKGEVTSSLGSGGRYDQAIGGLLGTEDSFSTVGISFGLDVIYTAMAALGKTKEVESFIDYYVVPINTLKESLQVTRTLRQQGYKVELEMTNKRLGKVLDRANKEKIRKVILIGENEVKNNQYRCKDMMSGQEEIMSFYYEKKD